MLKYKVNAVLSKCNIFILGPGSPPTYVNVVVHNDLTAVASWQKPDAVNSEIKVRQFQMSTNNKIAAL
jgi:hypothetical protein